jgi:hypothetical protein
MGNQQNDDRMTSVKDMEKLWRSIEREGRKSTYRVTKKAVKIFLQTNTRKDLEDLLEEIFVEEVMES